MDGRFLSLDGASVGGPGGLAGREVWDAVEAKDGWTVIHRQVHVDVDGQRRVYDGVTKSPSGKLIGPEVKLGSASLTGRQREIDSLLNSDRTPKGIGVGRTPVWSLAVRSSFGGRFCLCRRN